jgi:hypothetical protein
MLSISARLETPFKSTFLFLRGEGDPSVLTFDVFSDKNPWRFRKDRIVSDKKDVTAFLS